MTKAEARKPARLEAENAELRETLNRIQGAHMTAIRETVACRIAMSEILSIIDEAKEFAK